MTRAEPIAEYDAITGRAETVRKPQRQRRGAGGKASRGALGDVETHLAAEYLTRSLLDSGRCGSNEGDHRVLF